MKKLLLIVFGVCFGIVVKADEGFWLPMMLEKYTMTQMQSEGFKLTAEDIYSINQASLKDAVVGLGEKDLPFFYFCTGELISAQGLVLTNYHCVHDLVQRHASLSHNYLREGFWAHKQVDELMNPNLTASILVEMVDVTDIVLRSVTVTMTEKQRDTVVRWVCDSLEQCVEIPLKAKVSSYFHDNQYLMSVYKVFEDVRLVGVPQERVGKFGGDTDNWTFPRHTGDFALLRIYADKQNEPTDFSMANRPYRPIKFLEISAQGINVDDFAMVMGYPGTSDVYAPSYSVEEKLTILPSKIKIRYVKLNILKKAMSENESTALKYAAKAADISNSWKKWRGELIGFEQQKVVEQKRDFEKSIPKIQNKLNQYLKLYQKRKNIIAAYEYFSEALWNGSEVIPFAHFIIKKNKQIDTQNELKPFIKGFYENYITEIDCETFTQTLKLYRELPIENSLRFKRLFAGESENLIDSVFRLSVFTSKKQLMRVLSKKEKVRNQILCQDPLFVWMKELITYKNQIQVLLSQTDKLIKATNRTYMSMLMSSESSRTFYPDANSTMRLSYGTVQGYGGVWQTYLSGMMAKGQQSAPDYVVSRELADAFSAKDFGQYAQNGDLPLCFSTNCHTSGGNSGSPVLNGDGRLIGINFDRAWQGVMSDMYYDVSICRNIVLDIRFVLFYMEKIAKVPTLLTELHVIY